MTDTEFPTARVIWKARAIGQDINDPGGVPEEIPLDGIKVDLIPNPKVIECTNGAGDPVTYRIKEWHLVTANNGELINYEDPTNGIEIVASDAFPGYVVSWKSIIEDPSGTLPPIVKKWLAPAGSIVDLTTVISVPNNPNPIADYLQAVYDAREARDIAVASAAAASAAADATKVQQVTLTAPLAYALPVGTPANTVHHVTFTQDGVGGHTVTYDGQPVTVDLTAGASTQIELRPTGSGWAVAYPPAVATATAAQGALADSAIQAADLTSPQALRLNPLATAQRGAAPRILTLAVGTEDETAQGYVIKGTIAADTDNYRYGGRGWKITNNPGETYVKWVLNKPAPGATTPLATPAWQAMCLWVYIHDATKVTNLQVNIYHSADLSATYRWLWAVNTAPTTTLVTGWNFIRIPASFSSNNPTRNIYQAELLVGVNAVNASVTIGHWYLECPPKARFILTADRGYQTFYANIYPEMKARNWPVTFAVDCTLFGTGRGITSVMSLADMKTCAAENGNSISFHGWDGSPTSAMTEAQLRTDTLRSIKFLQREFPNSLGRFWRAAFVQNAASQRAAVYDYLLAAAAGGADNLGPTMWPPNSWYHIRRWSLDNYKMLGNITDLFTQAQATHLTYNVFVHGYDSKAPGWDVDSTRWALFRDSLDAAVAAGWAEVVTFEQLFLESGGTFSTSGGATVAEYTDATGARVVKSLL